MAKQDIAMQVLQQVVKLPVVKVDREKFLVEKFSKELDRKDIATLLEQGPTALLPQESLDRVAKACIKDNVLLASGTSVLAGLPGGIIMAITIPTDVAQFYAFSLKLAQELGYIYGFDDLWASRNELSEEAKNTLLLYLGVMLGVNGAGALLRSDSSQASHKSSEQESLDKNSLVSNFRKSFENFWCQSDKRRPSQRDGESDSYPRWSHFWWLNLCDHEADGRKIATGIVQASQLQ